MTAQLPTPGEMLHVAITSMYRGAEQGDEVTLNAARLALDIARELREGTVAPDQPAEAAIAAARGAFGKHLMLIPPDPPTEVIHIDQPMPTPNDRGSIQALVRQDLVERERVGITRYGTPLQAHNDRDALRDAYEEALDLTCYLRQMIAERESPQ